MIQGSPNRENRSRRTALAVPDPSGPSVRPVGPTPRQVGTAQPIPMVVDEGGIRAAQALANLFGAIGQAGGNLRGTALAIGVEEAQTAAIEAQNEQRAALATQMADQQARIAEERAAEIVAREERKERGVADAEAGRPEDPALAGFRSYSRAFGQTLGSIDGSRAASEWAARVAAGQIQDYEREAQEFLGRQTEALTGNAAYDAARLRAVRQAIDAGRTAWARQRVQEQQNEANNALAADAARMVLDANIGGEAVEDLIRRYQQINPGLASRAEAEILKMLQNNITTPAQLAAVMRAIRERVGDAPSLAERRPDLLPDFDRAVLIQTQQTANRQVEEQLRVFGQRIDEAKISLNPEQIRTLRQELDAFEQNNGAGAAVQTLRARLATVEIRLAEEMAERERYEAMLAGRALPNQELFNSQMQRAINVLGIQPTSAEPVAEGGPAHWQVAAEAVGAGMRVGLQVPPDIARAWSAGLMSGGVGAVASFRAIQSLTTAQNPEIAARVLSALTPEARAVFEAMAANPGGDPVQAAREARDRVAQAAERPLPTLTVRTGRKTEAEAQQYVSDAVETSAWRIASGSWLGRRFDVIDATLDALAAWNPFNPRGVFQANTAGRRESGVLVDQRVVQRAQEVADGIWSRSVTGKTYADALDEAMQGMAARGEVDIVILPDGTRRMTLRPQGAAGITDRLRLTPSGEPSLVPQIGPSVRNPYTGLDEDTSATLERDRQAAARILTGLTRGYADDRGALALDPTSSFRQSHGGFIPFVDARTGNQIRIVPGEETQIAGRSIIAGATADEIRRQFETLAPGSQNLIRLVPVSYGAGRIAYIVGLVPRFEHLSPESAARARGSPPSRPVGSLPISPLDSLRPLEMD